MFGYCVALRIIGKARLKGVLSGNGNSDDEAPCLTSRGCAALATVGHNTLERERTMDFPPMFTSNVR